MQFIMAIPFVGHIYDGDFTIITSHCSQAGEFFYGDRS
jgi:hypothetical protein